MSYDGTANYNEFIRYQFHHTRAGGFEFVIQMNSLSDFPEPSPEQDNVDLIVIDEDLHKVVDEAPPGGKLLLDDKEGILEVRSK